VAAHLDFGLFRNLKRVINLDSKVSDGAFQLAMPQQELNSPQVLRSLVNQRGLGRAHGVGAVNSRVKPYGSKPRSPNWTRVTRLNRNQRTQRRR